MRAAGRGGRGGGGGSARDAYGGEGGRAGRPGRAARPLPGLPCETGAAAGSHQLPCSPPRPPVSSLSTANSKGPVLSDCCVGNGRERVRWPDRPLPLGWLLRGQPGVVAARLHHGPGEGGREGRR